MHSFDSSVKRVGFACKWAELNKTGEITNDKELCTGGTTYAWAKRNSRAKVEEKILDVAKENILHTMSLVRVVSVLPKPLRMLRITSDMLSFYTMPEFTDFWQDRNIQDSLERWFRPIGELARKHDVRLSFHPDQFVVLASDRPEVVNNSIKEFEYHADMARWMGFGKQFQDFKINVHISGRAGPEGIRLAYERLSPEARSCLTIENEEITHNLDTVLELKDLCPIVMDIHHHWVNCGEYIQATDDRIKMVIDSWRGIRPTMHYSVSREDVLTGHSTTDLPDLQALINKGHNKQKLRAHSDYMWSDAVNAWAKSHWDWADVMVEAKAKNLASFKLHETWTGGKPV